MNICLNCGAELAASEEEPGVCYPCSKKLPPDEFNALRQLAEPEREKRRAEIISLGGNAAANMAQKKQELQEQAAQVQKRKAEIILTTETYPAGLEIQKRIEIVTEECVFGMNLFYDIFAGIRDIVGGRSGKMQEIFRKARQTVLDELREEAFRIGGNAVIGVNIQYSELAGKNTAMLMVAATGTAVVIT